MAQRDRKGARLRSSTGRSKTASHASPSLRSTGASARVRRAVERARWVLALAAAALLMAFAYLSYARWHALVDGLTEEPAPHEARVLGSSSAAGVVGVHERSEAGVGDAGSGRDDLEPQTRIFVREGEIPIEKQLEEYNVSEGLLVWPLPPEPVSPVRCYILGGQGDHVCVYQPICHTPGDDAFYTLRAREKCMGYNRTMAKLDLHCSKNELDCQVESNIHHIAVDQTWLDNFNKTGNATWIPGTTLLQSYDKSAANIAHFAGRVLPAFHILTNPRAYVSQGVDRMVVLQHENVMKRFINQKVYNWWHETVMKAVVAPRSLTIAKLQDFVKTVAEKKENPNPVYLITDLALPATTPSTVCYERAIVPGYLKGRFFVSDEEYRTTERAFQYPSGPMLPRDAVKFRKSLYDVAGLDQPKMSRRVVYLDRLDSLGRRAMDPSQKSAMLAALSIHAARFGYSFESILFDGKAFHEQISLMRDAAVAIGLHGANLVNAMFLPSGAAMIEIFPYRFSHTMYFEAGNAGIMYYNTELSTGEDYPGVKDFDSLFRCRFLNSTCKVFYRDQKVHVLPADVENLKDVLTTAILYIEGEGEILSREAKRSRAPQH